MSVLSQ